MARTDSRFDGVLVVRYGGGFAGVLGTTGYMLAPELAARDEDDPVRRRVTVMCEWALAVRKQADPWPGRLPHDRR
ncbi:MAG: hypothetical protein JOZ07_13165 [Solirubrobacterales bacterium]|nr:hypothetical protein [Solirubrobacterales bacterium]